MSATEAQTGRSALKKKLTPSESLFLGNSRRETGNFEVCRRNASNCTSCNMTEISVQSSEEEIGEETETASPTERRRHSFTRKLNSLKRVFSASCFTSCTLKPDEGRGHDRGGYRAVTILNRHTRDSVDLNATEMHRFSNAEHKSSVEEREAINTFKLPDQVIVPKLQSKAKSPNSQRLKAFWRQKPKKERIGEAKEYMAEDIIVLANEHADEGMTPAMTLAIEGNNEKSEVFKTPSHVSKDMKVLAGNPYARVICGGEIQMIPQSLEDSSTPSPDHGHSQNMDNLQQSTPNVIKKGTASEHPAAVRDEIRLYATVNSDSFLIHHSAAAENGPNKITASTVTDDDVAVVEDLHCDASDGSFYVMMVHSEQNSEQPCEKRELFLLETACSVVQVAIKTALKQFKDELLSASAHPDPYD